MASKIQIARICNPYLVRLTPARKRRERNDSSWIEVEVACVYISRRLYVSRKAEVSI